MARRPVVLALAIAAAPSCRCDRRAHRGPDEPLHAGSAASADVTTFHKHANRDGFYVDPAITASSAATMHRVTRFDGTLPGNVYAQPLYVEDGPGRRGAFYVATESDEVVALDEEDGRSLWTRRLGAPVTQASTGCGNILPLGITGTPAIDPATRLLVLSAATADAAGGLASHMIYALSIDDGAERWRVDVSTLRDPLGRPFSPQFQNDRGAVLIAGGVAYVAYGGAAYDCGEFRGWLVGVPLAHPERASAYATKTLGAGFWAPGGPAGDGDAVFAVSGNAIERTATWAGSEGVFRFRAGPTFSEQPEDVFVPATWSQTLDRHDWDLGGSGALVVDAPSMQPTALVVAAGKDGRVYVLDRANLGGVGGSPLGGERIINGAFIGAGAFATVRGATYVVLKGYRGATGLACPVGGGDLVALRLDPAAPNKMTTVWCADNHGQGAPIITTSDGSADALVWSTGAEDSGRLYAWDLATGRPVFGGGAAADVMSNLRRYTTVVDVRGRLYVAGDGRLYAFEP
jgi:outer membrane protein assembly factor BamB